MYLECPIGTLNINLAYYKEKQNDKTNNSRPTKLPQSNNWL